MPEEYACHSKLYILKFDGIEDAVDFAKETFPESKVYETMYDENENNEAWICVLAICDICNHNSIFFAPAEIYNEEIIGVECSNCGNMSVYPKEGSFEDA